MGLHAEMIEDLNITRAEYLRIIRCQQPIEELERKANKASRKNKWTREELDLANAKAMQVIEQINWC